MDIEDMDLSWEHTTIVEAISQAFQDIYNQPNSALVLIEDIPTNEGDEITYNIEGHTLTSTICRANDMFDITYLLKREGDIVHIECEMKFNNTPEMISVLDQMSDDLEVSQLTSTDRYKTACQILSIDTSDPKVIIEKTCEIFVIETLKLLRANPTENKFKMNQLLRGDIVTINGQLRKVESIEFGYDNKMEIYLYPEEREGVTATTEDETVAMF